MKLTVQAGGSINGEVRVPGDKSISHRCVMLGSLAEGVTEVTGFLNGADVLATRRAFASMGVRIERTSEGALHIHGVGLQGLTPPKQALDLGNSGTAMRLMMGLLSAQNFGSVLIGDESLSVRPMNRVADPLRDMGAKIATQNGRAPLEISPAKSLTGLRYQLPVASAQVKSAILLAGLYASGQTQVIEPAVTRDHTERMLTGFGYEVSQLDNVISVHGGGQLTAMSIEVPADISSAAFFIVAALIAQDSCVVLKHTGVNDTRDGVVSILKLMGANIELQNQRVIGGESVADIVVKTSDLQGVDIPHHLVPLAIDEFPAIAIAAACAQGVTRVSGAEELRVKECDRITATVNNLRAFGVVADEIEDGMVITGKGTGKSNAGVASDEIFSAAIVESYDDHRIAMAASLAALRANGTVIVQNAQNVETSFPNYVELMNLVGLRVEQSV